jgi:hypothetical protein
MSLAAAALLALSLSAPARAEMRERQPCPEGWVRVPTRDPNEPFHCRRQMDPSTPFIEMKANYKVAHCPQGFTPLATPGEMQRFRCVKDAPKNTGDPEAAPVLTAPERRDSRKEAGSAAPAVLEYTGYQMQGVMQFDTPKDWHLTDAWHDDVPTLYIEYDTGRQGKQPTLVITKYARGQEGWQDMDTAIAQEKEFQNSKEGAPTRVSGLPARATFVAKESRSVYVDAGKDEYYQLSYAASEDLFPVFEPAFKRLVSSFRLSRRALAPR